jgi:hypothetical protein
MSWSEEDRALLTRLDTNTEHMKEGINELKESMKTQAQNTRETFINIYGKIEKNDEKIDEVEKDFRGHKGKITGFAAAITAFWTVISEWWKS